MLHDAFDRKVNRPVQSQPDLNRSQPFFSLFLFLENILILLSNKFKYIFDRALFM